jgi:stearoyl-CoA 9-desaturase NADPH oxidoreductase
VAEVGASPEVHPLRRAFERIAGVFASPLELDHYVELINPRWAARELRGKVERVEQRTEEAKTIVIRPTHSWRGHRAGQYVRIGFLIDGVWHWRAYSLTSPPDAPDGCISITPKVLEEGKVSPYVNRRLEPGTLVRLGDVEGTFVLPEEIPEKILFVSAGSGITPVMSMLRSLEQEGELDGTDIRVIHSARDADDVIFGPELRKLAEHDSIDLHEQHTGKDGRLDPAAIQGLCPDWRERETFACGPAEMLDALDQAWEEAGESERLHMERFQPVIGGDGGEGEGGTVLFTRSECETECAGDKPILEAGEDAGLELKFGCRMGICHTCTGRLISGRLRDLRSGEVHGEEGQRVRICVNAPEGDVEVEL